MVLLKGEINEEMIEYLLQCNLEDSSVYLMSNGGSLADMFTILDILIKSNISELVITGYADSAAFILFVMYPGEKRVLPLTTSIIHIPRISVEISVKGNILPYDLDEVNIVKKQCLDFYTKFLNLSNIDKKEKKKLLSGEDVYWSASKINKFLKQNSYKKYEILYKD